MTTFTSEDRIKAEKDPSYYYSEAEWSKLGCGPIPDERNKDLLQLPLDLDYSRCK
jgi:hypothetical protein